LADLPIDPKEHGNYEIKPKNLLPYQLSVTREEIHRIIFKCCISDPSQQDKIYEIIGIGAEN